MTMTIAVRDTSIKDFFPPAGTFDKGKGTRSFPLAEEEAGPDVSANGGTRSEVFSEALIEGDLDATLKAALFQWRNMPADSGEISGAGASTVISREEFLAADLGDPWNFAYDAQLNYTKLYGDFQTQRENPVVYAEVRVGQEIQFYKIEIDKINPQSATKAEMHALVNYVYDDSEDIFTAAASVESSLDTPDYSLKVTQNGEIAQPKVDFADVFGEVAKRMRNYFQLHGGTYGNDLMPRKLEILEELLSMYRK